jgi:hypothetical protein
MNDLISKNFDAIIGITGTLLGVILGAVLNQISKRGKLKIFQKKFQFSYLKRSESGHYEAQKGITEDTESASASFDIDLYNSSSDQKIGRDIFLVFIKDRIEKKLTIKDLSTRRPSSFSVIIDQLENFNVPPKTLENLKLETYIEKQDLKLLNGANIFFEFKDERNKIRRFRIKQ